MGKHALLLVSVFLVAYPALGRKKYMQHPDIMHKTFLKAGAARVVLTIRPGFEKDFVSFVENGGLSSCFLINLLRIYL